MERPGIDLEQSSLRQELRNVVADILSPLCWVLAVLYGTYFLTQPVLDPDERISALRPYWLGSAAVFFVGALALRKRQLPDAWPHFVLGAIAAIVLSNSLRILYLGGPLFTNVLLLVMVGFATLALSLAWTISMVVACVIGWALVARLAPSDPGWEPTGVMMISGAAVAMLTQALRLRAMRRVVELRFAERRAEQERHRRAEEQSRVALINTAAHELATPLTPITIQLYGLKQSPHLDEQERRALEIVDNNFQRLNLVVQNIQEFARPISDTAISRIRTEIATLLDGLLGAKGAQLTEAGITLHKDYAGGIFADVDAPRIRLILHQLVDNAIKFTPHGGNIWMRLWTGAGQVRIEIEDDGAGIPPEELSQVFEPLAQPASLATRVGAHLGLHVARRIANAHGGSLRLSARPGGGTRVELALPAPQTN